MKFLLIWLDWGYVILQTNDSNKIYGTSLYV